MNERRERTNLCLALTTADYLGHHNGDQFNLEMKRSLHGQFMESSRYISKRGSKLFIQADRLKYAGIATAAFHEKSLAKGRMLSFCVVAVDLVHLFPAALLLKENLPFEYLTTGKQMRTNIDYELNCARKRSELDYQSMFDPTTFK